MSKTLTPDDIKAIGKEFTSVVEKLLKGVAQMETTNASELMNVDDVCEKLKLGKQSIYNMIKKNEIKSVKIGKQIYVKISDFNDYINTKYND
jgi:excisionase family DNA binding protein